MPWSRQPTEAQKQEFLPVLKKLIEESFEQIEPFLFAHISVQGKSNGTPVTDADKSTELRLRTKLEAHYPQHGIFGEEYGVKEPSGPWPRYRWILDPIDGTRAFISNSFQFGTLLALECASSEEEPFRPILASISFPVAKLWVIGTVDACTLYRKVGEEVHSYPAHVRDCASLEDATMLVTSHWTKPEQVGDKRLQTLVDRCKLYRTWGDCFGYFSVATGGSDLMIDPDLSYWDVAALLPEVEGAGGILASCKGGNPLEELSALCCGSETLYKEVLAILNPAS